MERLQHRYNTMTIFRKLGVFLIGLTIYFLSFGAAAVLVYRSGETESFRLTYKVPPLLSDIVGLSLFIAPFQQFPITLLALIGGLFRNSHIKGCISWSFPILMSVWMIHGLSEAETDNGEGTNLVTPDSPLSLRVVTNLEGDLSSLLMSVV